MDSGPVEDSPHAIARTADRLRREGKFDEAIALCLQELTGHPAYISARMVLGRSYLERGDHQKAEEAFRRVLDLESDNVRAYVHLGQLCEAQHRFADAIGHYEAAREYAPLDREILAGLARLHQYASTSEPAGSEVKREVVIECSHDASASEAVQERGELFATETMADLYASQGLVDRAAFIYEQLLVKEPFRDEIRAKLEALREGKGASTTSCPVEAEQEPLAAPSELLRPPVPRNNAEQVLLDKLEHWLDGIRRYRNTEATARR